MQATRLDFLADACGGKLLGNKDAVIKDVKIDSRVCKEGDLFVCVIGENNNGHKYIKSAYESGCRAFLVSEEPEILEGASYVLCENTEAAFARMADGYLSQFGVKRVAVTGSVGKTTTKMLTAAVLSSKYNTICTQKNLNTQLGNSLTAFMATADTQAVVFEMGMDGRGQISSYVAWVKPEIAIITNVGVSHMENLGSRDAIADAKLEVVEQFTDACTLVVNSRSDFLRTEDEIRSRAVNKSSFAIVRVGDDIDFCNLKNDGLGGIEFTVEGVDFALPLLGEHNAIDACLAIAAGKCLGVSLSEASEALKKVEATEKRLSMFRGKDIILLDDSYNASPDSMRAGIAALESIDVKRRIAVLGDMRELGAAEDEGHIAVGRFAAEHKVDLVIAVGAKKDYYKQGILESGKDCSFISAEDLKDAGEKLLALIKAGDAVLVKGSNSTKVSEISKLVKEYINE